MAFQKKTWVDRLTEFATRRIITNTTTRQETLVEVARAEGEIYEPGDAFNADTMNDLEDRINDAFEEVGKGVGVVDTYDNVMDMISHGEIEEETFVSITDDSDDDSISAIAIDYDNTDSGMTATEVQGAIDELKDRQDTLSTHLNALPKIAYGSVSTRIGANASGNVSASFPSNLFTTAPNVVMSIESQAGSFTGIRIIARNANGVSFQAYNSDVNAQDITFHYIALGV